MKQNDDGINGKCTGTGFKTGDGGQVHLCVLLAE